MVQRQTKRRRVLSVRGAALARGALGLLVVIATCWGALVATVPAPAGNPVLVAAAPSDGEVVKSPDEVRLTFDQPVPAGLATVRMTNVHGDQVVAVRPYNPPGAANTVAVPMPETRFGGTYSVAWSLPSSQLEPISGTFTFDVFQPSAPVAVPDSATKRDPVVAAVHSVARLAATAALVLGIGVVCVLVMVWPAGARTAPARRVIGFAWCALVVATLATIASFGGYAARTSLGEAFDPALLAGTFGSDIGAGLLARLFVLMPITIGLILLLTGTPAESAAQRWSRAGAVLGSAAALAATWSFSRPHDPLGSTPLELGAETALLLAVAVAVGGPVLLWLVLRNAGDTVLHTAVPRLARVMPVSGALLLAMAAITADGWQLVALLVLGALVVGTGLAGHWWVRRRTGARGTGLPERGRLRRVAAVATVAVAVALLAAAVTAPTGQTQLALAAWPAGGNEQVHSRLLDVR